LFHGNVSETAKIAIREIALAKGQPVNTVMIFHGYGTVVQEASHTAAVPAKLAYYDSQAVKLANRVNAGRTNLDVAIFGVPQLQVTAPSLLTCGSELKLGIPVVVILRPFRPHGGPPITRRRRSKHYSIRKDIWRVAILSRQFPARNMMVVLTPNLVAMTETLVLLNTPTFFSPLPVAIQIGNDGIGQQTQKDCV